MAKKKSKPVIRVYAHVKPARLFRMWMLILVFLAVILAGSIVYLDQRAVRMGYPGLLELLTGVPALKSDAEVEKQLFAALAAFRITRENVILHDSIEDENRIRVKLLVFQVRSEEAWMQIFKGLERKLSAGGIHIHNRLSTKSDSRWNLIFMLGIKDFVTHRLEIRWMPGSIGIASNGSPTRMADDQKPATESPRIALVFDDFGSDMQIAERFLEELNFPIALAVIPYQKHSSEIAEEVRRRGQTLFLHMPMEPFSDEYVGKHPDGMLRTAMSNDEIRLELSRAIDSLIEIDGMNNHMGSKFTADRGKMRSALALLKEKNIPFLDSRTSAKTMAEKAAADVGLPYATRAVFLDQGSVTTGVEESIKKLAETARSKGFAVGIGHSQSVTLEAVKTQIPKLESEGFVVVSAVDLMAIPK